jgi:hypothetical protein
MNRLFRFYITAHRRGASPIYLPALARSPDAALVIGRIAFPGHLITVSHPKPHRLTSA